MRKRLVHATLVIGCATSVALPAVAQVTPAVTALGSAATLTRHLARGDEHRYRLSLAAGELVAVVVEQRGLDVVVEVRDPEGHAIADFQDEIRPTGEEPVEFVSERAGEYALIVRPAEGVAAAGAYAIRVAGRRPATGTDRAMQQSRALRAAAVRLERAGRFDDARPLFARALSASEPLRGAENPYVATLLFDTAGNALERHDDATARALYRRAQAALERRWGPEHPYPAMVRSRLAVLDERAGEYARAEAAVRESLATIERSLGADHPWSVRCLVTLGNLRSDAGDRHEAEAIDRRALGILDRTHETGTIMYAGLLNNLADLRRQAGDLAGAETLFERSLAIGEARRGPDSYFVSTALQNLGIVARERKDYAAALADDTRALAIRERLVGPDHPDVAPLLNNMATVYRATGDLPKALETHFRALRIWEKSEGPYHRGTLVSVGNIARTYAAAGDVAHAVAFERRADAILEKQLVLSLSTGSERQKLAFARSVAARTDRTLSLHLDQAPGDPDAAALAVLVLLQRKGRVQDAMTDVFAAIRRTANPDDRRLLGQLNGITAQLARLALNPPTGAGPDERQQVLTRLETRREEIERRLSDRSAAFRARTRPVTLEAVQAAIPADAALLEFAVFHPFDPAAERNAEAYGPAHYAAYVVRGRPRPIGRDLGEAAAIDRLIARFRNALRNPASPDVQALARALDERIMQPLRSALDGVGRLLISPDGELNLVPFEALADPEGRYLIERYTTSYLTSGRDLLRMQVPRPAPGRPVVLADPLFGEPPAPPRPARATAGASVRPTGGSLTAGAAYANLYFARLFGSASEARAIRTLFPDAILLTGRRATKAALEQVKAPRILHIASHGFFLGDPTRHGDPAAAPQNPLLRSGLALAGANHARRAGGDGILTALEASGLDLWGTRLVTLSACDTGVGEVRDGEGVYGLRRAFVLAGAETLVMSLWPVSDYVARDAMIAFYARLRAGDGRADALRRAKLAILDQAARRHPYFWAGFIESGEWADLNGAR